MKGVSGVLATLLAHALFLWTWESESFLVFWGTAFLACWASCFWLKASLGFEYKASAFVILSAFYLGAEVDDDVYRYLIEGQMLLKGVDPYLVPPLKAGFEYAFIDQVNHADWTAIYAPFYVEFMGLLAYFGAGVGLLKCSFLLIHLLNAHLIKKVASPDLAHLFLFSPFILFETIAQAHLEQLLVLGLLLLLWGTKNQKSTWVALGMVLSCWVKWWLLPALPLLIRKSYLKALSIFALMSLIVFVPFLNSFPSMLNSLLDFREMWSCGYPFLWVTELLGHHWGRLSVVAFLLMIGASVLLLGGHLSEQIWQLFRWSLFFAPTLHPWYFVFPLVAALCSGKKTTFFVIGFLAMGLHHPEFYVRVGEGWVSNWIYSIPLFVALFFSEWRLRHHFFLQKGEAVESFSVVTPVLNEEANLEELGRQIGQHSESISDWVVVDAGSEDGSKQMAETMGAKVYQPGVKGRGEQIAYGVDWAEKDWIVVIHADTRLPTDFFQCLKFHISRVPNLDGGAFKMAYRDYQHMGPLHWLNDLKFRLFGVSFGDQSQFFNRKRLKSRGGFPKLAIMEDLELSLVWKGGHVAYISETKSLTSPRRWKKVGRLSNTLQILKLLFLYLINRHWNPPVDVRKLYQRYYAS